MGLEERTIETLPDRCQNCGATLTEQEKRTALEEGATVVLCTTCAAEVSALPEEAEELGDV
jgi:DNA-directed RNA polymerase subunit RPC12/RpoP